MGYNFPEIINIHRMCPNIEILMVHFFGSSCITEDLEKDRKMFPKPMLGILDR